MNKLLNITLLLPPKLGKLFLTELRKSQKHIAKNPKKFQIRYLNIRICFTKVFSFGIHYHVTGDTVVIFALFHSSQDSASWEIKHNLSSPKLD